MRLIDEHRTTHLRGPDGTAVEARERVRGIDLQAGALAVLFERHTPIDLRHGDITHTFSNHGIGGRMAPFLAAPAIAMLITKLARMKGRQ